MSYVRMSDLYSMSDVQSTPSGPSGVKDIDVIDALLSDAMKISGPLVASNAQVEDKRRSFADLMNLASAAAGRYQDAVAKRGWTQEAAAFGQVKDLGAKTVALAGEHKSDATWSALDAAAHETSRVLQGAKAMLFARARAEANGAVDSIQTTVSVLKVKSPMDDSDWTSVDYLVTRINDLGGKLASLPLEAKDASVFSGAQKRLTAALEAKVAALSSPFSNKAEELLVTQTGVLAPQQGRKLANWVDRNKVWIGAGALGLLAVKAMTGGSQHTTVVRVER